MSIALMVEKVDGVKNTDYLPISGQKFFIEKWVPLCDQYNLKLIPLFQTGFTFTEKDLPILLSELEILKVNIREDEAVYLRERIDLLLDKLKTLTGHEVNIFIG